MWEQAFRSIIDDTVSCYCEVQTSKLNELKRVVELYF